MEQIDFLEGSDLIPPTFMSLSDYGQVLGNGALEVNCWLLELLFWFSKAFSFSFNLLMESFIYFLSFAFLSFYFIRLYSKFWVLAID